ncbi:MAG: hypothetical protein ACLFRL_08505, partial [Desulfohalobiaceae bacterium]
SKEIEQVRAELGKDIEQRRAELSKEIEQVRADLTQEIARSKQDILRWTIGLLFAQLITILAALIGVNFMA